MEEFKVKLPTLTFSSYQMLIRALQYYQISSIEFATDGELVAKLYELIDYIENSSDMIKIK